MNIELFEKYNKGKYNQVLNCSNLLFQPSDDPSWKEAFIKTFTSYGRKKVKYSNGNGPSESILVGVSTMYTQKFKYRRYNTKFGLQTFPREVRKYTSGEYYEDIELPSRATQSFACET